MSIQQKSLKQLYRQMLRIRMVEEAIADRYSEQKMRCPTHLSIGQEAAAVGVCSALTSHDQAVSGHRAHGHYLAKGGDLKRMLAEIYGKKTGCSGGKGGSMHLIDKAVGFMGSTAIVAGTIPVGVGLALSSKIKSNDNIIVIFLGDGAIEEGVFYDSINFAGLKSLPVVFVCENNMYSVYSPLHVRQPKGRRIYEMVEGMGVKVAHGDGNNVIEVARLADRAVSAIKSGDGPRFLELETYRWREHCGPNYDNEIGYRDIKEFESWKERDPVRIGEKYLMESNVSCEELNQMRSDIENEINEAFEFAENSHFPDPRETFTNLYSY